MRFDHDAPFMLTFLPFPIRLPLVFLLVGLNVLVHATVLLSLALIKALVPIAAFRKAISRVLIVIAEQWIAVNGFLFALVTRTRWVVDGLDGLNREGWYLVLSNHQSWVDIPVLQRTLNRRIPFLKFFLKQQLKWVPVMGLAWWALDFPFMQRYSRETLEKHPELRGRDKEATRFTTQKHAQQASPYTNLLRPRAGGVAFVLDAMGDILKSVVDVTIVYPAGIPTLVDLLANRVVEIRVRVRELPIPATLLHGDYENDEAFRARFQEWINGLWAEKDACIAGMKGAEAAPPGASTMRS
jgi:1-acyl-sn-glycerol-3-phosphate acyltransferase